jgi:beta-galactosidase
LANKLARYVRAGGILVLGAQAGLKDKNCHIVQATPPGLLAKLAGVEIEDWTTLPAKESRAARLDSGQEIVFNTFVERLRPTTAAVAARWTIDDSLLADAPAITVNRVGKGRVYYIGGYSPVATLELLLINLFALAKIAAPPEVEIVHRAGRKAKYIVLLNHSCSPRRIALPKGCKNVLTGERAGSDFELGGFDAAVLSHS